MCRTFCNIVRQWFATGRLFSQGTAVYSTDKNWWPRYNWNIVESGVKHHKQKLRLSYRSCICVLCVMILPLYHISIISWNCSNSVVFFVYFYHNLELFQQCGIFCLFLSYLGTVPTVWYFCLFLSYAWTVPTVWYFLFISIRCWNCSNSVVFFVYFYRMLELLQQCGMFC